MDALPLDILTIESRIQISEVLRHLMPYKAITSKKYKGVAYVDCLSSRGIPGVSVRYLVQVSRCAFWRRVSGCWVVHVGYLIHPYISVCMLVYKCFDNLMSLESNKQQKGHHGVGVKTAGRGRVERRRNIFSLFFELFSIVVFLSIGRPKSFI